jgi:hypothetical protein
MTFDYQQYLASREWALKREAVRKRAGNKCERCRAAKMDAVHHKTYANVGHEPLEDLQAICNPCHEFLSGKSNNDPCKTRYPDDFTYADRQRANDLTLDLVKKYYDDTNRGDPAICMGVIRFLAFVAADAGRKNPETKREVIKNIEAEIESAETILAEHYGNK